MKTGEQIAGVVEQRAGAGQVGIPEPAAAKADRAHAGARGRLHVPGRVADDDRSVGPERRDLGQSRFEDVGTGLAMLDIVAGSGGVDQILAADQADMVLHFRFVRGGSQHDTHALPNQRFE